MILEIDGPLTAAHLAALRERWRRHVEDNIGVMPMAMTVRNLQHAFDRPPPPAPWSPRMGYQPRPTYYGNSLPPVPWIIRGNNAALSLGAILLGALALWMLT